MEQFFYRLNLTDQISAKLGELLARSVWSTKHGFELAPISPIHFITDKSLFSLIKKFNAHPTFIRMDPMTWYNWHKDIALRQCAINFLLSGTDSKMLFKINSSKYVTQFEELKYNGNFYLLNTQEDHSVLNFNNTRYLLSIGFEQPYNEILEYCKKIEL